MGAVGCAYDNSLMESFFGSMQINRRTWPTRAEPATAIFEWIEAFYNPPDATPPRTTSAPLTTNSSTTPPRMRHDHRTETVRKSGDRSRILWVSVHGHTKNTYTHAEAPRVGQAITMGLLETGVATTSPVPSKAPMDAFPGIADTTRKRRHSQRRTVERTPSTRRANAARPRSRASARSPPRT